MTWSILSPGQDWPQFIALALAFALSSLVGLEREFRLRSAGLRTHALVGLGAALIMIVSKYGFADVLVQEHTVLDPARIAAQIVSGIGFIGGGLIFVRKDTVRGLTTAASIWVTAAIGMACGAGLPWLAVFTTAGHFVVAFGYTRLVCRIMDSNSRLHITYKSESEALSRILDQCAANGFAVQGFHLDPPATEGCMVTSIGLHLQGHTPVRFLVEELAVLPGVLSVAVMPSYESA